MKGFGVHGVGGRGDEGVGAGWVAGGVGGMKQALSQAVRTLRSAPVGSQGELQNSY